MPKIHINTIELDYEDIGYGKPLLLLHGLGSTKKDWELQIPFLASNYRVITPDLRGHGNSAKPKNYGVSFMAEDMKQLLDTLTIEKATVVGFSMGGAVAFQLAYAYPECIDKLVIVNSGPDFNDMGTIGQEMLTHRTTFLRTKGLAALAKEVAYNMFPESHQETMRSEFEERYRNNDFVSYYNTFVTLMNWGLGDNIKKIKAKTLVIASDMDYTPIAFKEAYIKKLSDATLHIIENSRHGVTIDQPEAFNTTLHNFLSNA